MSTDLYFITIKSVQGKKVTMDVQTVNPDVGDEIYASKTFALGLLATPLTEHKYYDSEPVTNSPISTFMDRSQANNEGFLAKYADMFITDVSVDPIESTNDLQAVRYTVVVYHELWTRHLRAGMSFGTTMWFFDGEAEWSGEPVAPGFYALKAAPKQSNGFENGKVEKSIKKYFKNSELKEFTYATQSIGNYMQGETFNKSDGITVSKIEKFDGVAVLHDGIFGKGVGTLVIKQTGEISFFEQGEGFEGSSSCQLSDLNYVSEAILAEKVFDEERTLRFLEEYPKEIDDKMRESETDESQSGAQNSIVEDKCKQAIAEIKMVSADSLSLSSTLEEIGVDELDLTEIAIGLEDSFDIVIEDGVIAETDTISKIIDTVLSIING